MNQLLGGANAGLRHSRRGRRSGTPTQYEIVGVVTDLGTNPSQPDLIEMVIYHSLRSSTRATALIRMRGNDPLQFSSRLRDLTSALDPTLRLRIVTFSEMKRQQMIGLRLMLLGSSLVVVDRAAAVGGRHLRDDVVHRIAAPKSASAPRWALMPASCYEAFSRRRRCSSRQGSWSASCWRS